MAGFFSRENRWNNKLTVLVWISLASVHIGWATDETTVVNGKPTKCGIYLAPSSIPGAGLGMYAGDMTFVPGDRVTLGDIVIPISEYHWNNKVGPFADDVWTPDEYTWNSPVFPYMDDEGRDSDLIMGMSPGVGAAANSYLTLVNIEYGDTETDRPVPPQSPGTGANTPYYAREYHATKTIPPGGEIFVDYGSTYFRSRPRVYGYMPLPDTFRQTDALLKKYLHIKAETLKRKGGVDVDEIRNTELWSDYYDIIKCFASVWETSRILNGLPDDEATLPELMQAGGSGQKDYNRSIREVSWLEEHGQCMDNIRPGNSTNIDAGRGAFANRFIPKGGLVAPAPLIHVADYDAMRVFQPMDDPHFPGWYQPNRNGPWNYQLFLNYCFGHQESTLALCPYGLLTAFINHSHNKPNARIVWSQEMRHADWREEEIDEWASELHTGLQIDFVALRDIEEGEEIFIDYGKAWEDAWQEHVKNYQPRSANYIPAFELNKMIDIDYRTGKDLEYEVDNVVLMCRLWYIQQFVNEIEDDVECMILEKRGNDRYVAQLKAVVNHNDDAYITVTPGHILWDVPSDAFFFYDLPYTRDHYLPNAFRHAMMIPDDMFPAIWKNKVEPRRDSFFSNWF